MTPHPAPAQYRRSSLTQEARWLAPNKAEDLVQLPKLTISGAITLGQSILTAAHAVDPLPAPVEKALPRLKKAHTALRKAAQERLPAVPTEDTPAVRDADRDIDAAWSATFYWATGWSKLPGKTNAAKAAIAQKLLNTLFSDGLKFTQIKVELEWGESQTRLDTIASQHLDQSFEELGGGEFLKTIKAMHKVYGDVLGTTKPKTSEAEVKQAGKALEDFLGALRKYVVSVTASVDEEDKESAVLAEKLLDPLSAWESAPPQEKQDPPAPPHAEAEGDGKGEDKGKGKG